MKKILVFTTAFLFYISQAIAQNATILEDSVYLDSNYLVLQELKINSKSSHITTNIYKTIQHTYNVLDNPNVIEPEKRIQQKKEIVQQRILENSLREENTGFERYEIYYDKNSILNLSISIQSYGAAWEGMQYYCFDLNSGKNIGLKLFTDQNLLLKKCKKKIMTVGLSLPFRLNDLLSFRIITDGAKKVIAVDFFIFDVEHYRTSGYEKHAIHFDWKEIEMHISPIFKKRLI